MKIAFFTEMGFTGKVPRNHENMRTEFAWMVALEADHYNIQAVPNQDYDLGIVIIPKKNPTFDLNSFRSRCKKVAVMQEGPHWYFQDYTMQEQVSYYNTLRSADIIFVHNYSDIQYFKGLTEHNDVRQLKSLMIEDAIGEVKDVEREGVIIGGNFTNWYGGFDSFIIAKEYSDTVYAPSMGRKIAGEEGLVTHLPYMSWKDWIHKLNEFKVGVHLMRTHAAGTFALNCARLGIPCIGYKGLDTQEVLHPQLTVRRFGQMLEAKELIRKLREDEDFYKQCSNKAIENYNKFYTEEVFKDNWTKLIL